MKKLFLFLSFLLVTFGVNAQFKDQTCHFGLTFEISSNPSWGFGEPVVLSVEPYSQAEKAGIKVGDIIMEVNSTATYLRDYKTIYSWFFDNSTADVFFTIRNMNTYFKEYKLRRDCNDVNSLSESQLATSFSFYSLESVNDRTFSMPIQIVSNTEVDYSDYHTFDFLAEPNAPEIDSQINSIIEKSLNDRGLTRDTKNPDVIIQTYYSFQPNTLFNAAAKPRVPLKTWRYDTRLQQMVYLPILPGDNGASKIDGQYILELGVRFFDKKYIDPSRLTQIWDCVVTEYLSDKYSLEEYAQIHTPLLMMNFPYTTNRTIVKYVVNFKKFQYTGMHFNTQNMGTLTQVDENSPAWEAGIRAGNVIRKINEYKMDASKDELTNAYKRFIIETMQYRDPYTKFTDANGFPDCMFWDKGKSSEIAKSFENKIYMPYFSYLFGFDKFVNPKTTNSLQLEVDSRNQKRILNVKPEIRTSVVISAN